MKILFKSILKSKLQILTFIYILFYIIYITNSIGIQDFSANPEVYGMFVLFILFLVAFVFTWFNKLLAGILFLTWNAGIWIEELFFVEHEEFYLIISGLPIIVLGTFFVLKGIEYKKGQRLTANEKWRESLTTLTITFTVLYSLVIIQDLSGNLQISYFHPPGIFLILLIAVYFTGFVLSWKYEFYAGILFIIWYIGVFILFKSDLVISNYGPWNFAGFVVFLNGYFFIRYGYQKLKREKKTEESAHGKYEVVEDSNYKNR